MSFTIPLTNFRPLTPMALKWLAFALYIPMFFQLIFNGSRLGRSFFFLNGSLTRIDFRSVAQILLSGSILVFVSVPSTFEAHFHFGAWTVLLSWIVLFLKVCLNVIVERFPTFFYSRTNVNIKMMKIWRTLWDFSRLGTAVIIWTYSCPFYRTYYTNFFKDSLKSRKQCYLIVKFNWRMNKFTHIDDNQHEIIKKIHFDCFT